MVSILVSPIVWKLEAGRLSLWTQLSTTPLHLWFWERSEGVRPQFRTNCLQLLGLTLNTQSSASHWILSFITLSSLVHFVSEDSFTFELESEALTHLFKCSFIRIGWFLNRSTQGSCFIYWFKRLWLILVCFNEKLFALTPIGWFIKCSTKVGLLSAQQRAAFDLLVCAWPRHILIATCSDSKPHYTEREIGLSRKCKAMARLSPPLRPLLCDT